jgi:hypothetical protein
MIDGKRILLCATILSYFLTILSGITYLFTNENVVLLTTLLLLLISSLLFCWNNIKYYLIHFIFYITIFIFLVSRPTIDYFRDGALDTYQPIAYRFSFLVVIVSILGLTIGGLIASYYLSREKMVYSKVKRESNITYLKKLRLVSLSVFLVTYPFYFLRLFERLLYRLQTSYYNYYANFESQLPYFTYILSTFTVYAMCVYLATKPKKLHATMVLVAFIIANLIHLAIGTRNPFILSLIFAFVYYFMREQTEKGKWIGFKEKIAIYLGTPVIMLVMGALNYIRDNAQVSHSGIFDLLLDFIYKQGTSFGVLARGFLYNSSLPYRDFRNFTFGPIIDYFARGSLGIIFGAKPFEHTTNSIELAIDSNSYAHNLSYLVLNKEYLRGHGIGSSYIMELYTDYGMLGVFLLSILLGLLFIAMLQVAYRSRTILFALSLLILNNLFFMPRSSFSESFFNLFTMQFWGIVLVMLFVAKMLTKKNQYLIQKRS